MLICNFIYFNMISTTKLSNFKKNQLPSKLLTYNPFNNSLLLYDGTFINSYSSINHKLIISTVFKTNDSLADIISASYSHLLNLYFLLTSDGILHILSSITH